jgi:alpha-N-arabinofuranosidase
MTRTGISRRGFVLGAGAAAVARLSAAQECRIAVRTGAEIGTIRPELHGHFAEHLGSCTYGGIWVGPGSSVPNVQGFRKQAVDDLKALGIPVLRWPGGCFADDYHWRDGIGPAAKRPSTVNMHWGNYTEDNSFGTHEFIAFCRLIGAEPYLAGNVGSGTPRELRDWVEYCNYPSGSTLSDLRAANGSRAPFNVKYWGVGNENWGCGGNMTPEEYAGHYRQFGTFTRPMGDTRPFLIACGPNGNNLDWTRRFFDTMNKRLPLQGYSMHFYSNGKSPATQFTVENMRAQLSSFANIEKAVIEQRELMDKYDPQRRVGLMVDEWGVWDRMVPEEEKRYGRLWQQITMRSAVAAALGLNVFHRQAEKLIMCNIAQMINVLHAVLLTEGDRCVRTSTYYAFDLLKAHRGRKAVKVDNSDADPLGLSVSASRQDKELVLTLVNPKHDTPLSVTTTLDGASAAGAKARLLHHADFNACNTFDRPDTIVPRPHPVTAKGANLSVELPPLSILTAIVALA